MGNQFHSRKGVKLNEAMKFVVMAFVGILLGFSIGMNFPARGTVVRNFLTNFSAELKLPPPIANDRSATPEQEPPPTNNRGATTQQERNDGKKEMKISASPNPRGAESLPPGIIEAESDLYLRRLWGKPSEDLTSKPKYLITFTVGIGQKENINLAVKKFSGDFTIMLFHYDGKTNEWDEFEWSKKAIHISALKQTKWWYAKRFLHPDIVAPYDYIFIWDEDLGVENFNALEYIRLAKKYGLEISQPALGNNSWRTWNITKRRDDVEVHKESKYNNKICRSPKAPPCAGFVEIMAPVFTRSAWRCVWHLIQNDLVHGWGLDGALSRCVKPAHEKIGVVDAQWIYHQHILTLKGKDKSTSQTALSESEEDPQGVKARCRNEWRLFMDRLHRADEYFKSMNPTIPRAL